MKIGIKEIQKALDDLVLDKEKYQACEIDNMIAKYYGLSDVEEYEKATEMSGDFNDIGYVFELTDDIMESKGYKSYEDMTIYRKVSENNAEN